MLVKIRGVALASLISFCLCLVLFHAVANAEPQIISPLPLASPTMTPTPSPTLTPTATPLPTRTPTATPTPQPTIAVVVDLDSLFEKYSNEYHTEKELLKKIARCESNFNSQATNGPYTGMFQFAEETWTTIRTRMGMDTNGELRKNAEESIRTASYMLAEGQATAWSGCL